jgi:hypothetical protein
MAIECHFIWNQCKWVKQNIESSWSWTYGSWIYNNLCNQCLPPFTLWVRIPLKARCTRCNIMW